MKKLALIVIVLTAAYFRIEDEGFSFDAVPQSTNTGSTTDAAAAAFANRQSNIQMQGSGEVTRTLADDNNGDRHQRFIVELPSGQTLLVAHNIDLAERIAALKAGDRIEFNGEYEWNADGGVIHWTHRDPNGRHEAGWLKHNGRTYQ